MKKWYCKKCGGEISGRDVIEQHLEVHEEGEIYNIYDFDFLHSYYVCDSCKTQTKVFQGSDIEKLEKIAELKEATE